MASSTSYCGRCMSTFDGDPVACPNLGCGSGRPDPGWGRLLGRGDLLDRRYRVEHPLAVGGAGITYLAREVDDAGAARGPLVAVKVLYQARAQGPFLRRLQTEAQILQELAHPHIVELRGFVHRTGAEPYLVTRFEEGGNLTQHVARHGPLPARVAAAVVRQVLGALDTAHQRGVVHRDLKPDNVLLRQPVTRDAVPEVRVADFGIAKIAGSGLNSQLTRAGAFVGTPEYAAPEQFLGQTPTPATDLFAAGGLLYFLLTGRPPFQFSVRHDVDQSLSELLEQLPLHLPPVAEANADQQLVLQTALDVMTREKPGARSTVPRAMQVLEGVDVPFQPLGSLDTEHDAVKLVAAAGAGPVSAAPLVGTALGASSDTMFEAVPGSPTPTDIPTGSFADAPAPPLPPRPANRVADTGPVPPPLPASPLPAGSAVSAPPVPSPRVSGAPAIVTPTEPSPSMAPTPAPAPERRTDLPPPPPVPEPPPKMPDRSRMPTEAPLLPVRPLAASDPRSAPPSGPVTQPSPASLAPTVPEPPPAAPLAAMPVAAVPVPVTNVPPPLPPSAAATFPPPSAPPSEPPPEPAPHLGRDALANPPQRLAMPTLEPDPSQGPDTVPLPPPPVPAPPQPAPVFPDPPPPRRTPEPVGRAGQVPTQPLPPPPPADPPRSGGGVKVAAAAGAGCFGLSLVSSGVAVLVGLVAVGVLLVVGVWFLGPGPAPVVVPADENAERFRQARPLAAAGTQKVQRQIEIAAPDIAKACGQPARVHAELLVDPEGHVIYAKVDDRGLDKVDASCVKRELERRRLSSGPPREGIAKVDFKL